MELVRLPRRARLPWAAAYEEDELHNLHNPMTWARTKMAKLHGQASFYVQPTRLSIWGRCNRKPRVHLLTPSCQPITFLHEPAAKDSPAALQCLQIMKEPLQAPRHLVSHISRMLGRLTGMTSLLRWSPKPCRTRSMLSYTIRVVVKWLHQRKGIDHWTTLALLG